ncbi:transcriptional regulator [Mycolicibacterium aubagnense]|nr:transcriptional regulator [Mycolicibacterium aubagnense]
MVHSPGYSLPDRWDPPSDRVRELMRQAAKIVIHTRQTFYDEVSRLSLTSNLMASVSGHSLADDPIAAEAITRSNRSNQLHWAAANISHPGEPVPANTDAETLAIARYLVRRGISEAAMVETYRLAQSISLQSWMKVVYRLTSDPEDMRELFEVSERSITMFLGETISAVHRQMRIERDNLTSEAHPERRATVMLILDGAPLGRDDAERQLGYQLDQGHTAAIIWGNESAANLADLDQAAELLIHTVHGSRTLSVLASADTRWLWLPGANNPDFSGITTALGQLPGVRIAVGSTAAGIEGFRRSHLDAIETQRVMTKAGSTQQIASFADVQIVALLTADPEQANRFIRHTLGDFEYADPELQQTVLAYIYEQCNASQAAARLFTHRNTLMRRLIQAEALLPRPLDGATVHVALALEALQWRDAGGSRRLPVG